MSEQEFVDVELDMFDPSVQLAAEAAQFEEANTQDEKVIAFIRRRALAYRRVFADPNKVDDLRIVMGDLAKWARAFETTWSENGKRQDLLEGRRETYLRIAKHTRLSFDELFDIYTNARTQTEL